MKLLPNFKAFLKNLWENAGQVKFTLKTTNGWEKGLKPYMKNPQVAGHVNTLVDILKKPRTHQSEDEKETLRTKFNEHAMTSGGISKKEKESLYTIPNDHKVYRYHLPSAKGLRTGCLTLNVSYANDHSEATLHSVTEHQ